MHMEVGLHEAVLQGIARLPSFPFLLLPCHFSDPPSFPFPSSFFPFLLLPLVFLPCSLPPSFPPPFLPLSSLPPLLPFPLLPSSLSPSSLSPLLPFSSVPFLLRAAIILKIADLASTKYRAEVLATAMVGQVGTPSR